MSEKKLAGLWIDSQKAIVVKNHDAQNAFKFSLQSGESGNPAWQLK